MGSTNIRRMYEKSGAEKGIPDLLKEKEETHQNMKISRGEYLNTIEDILSALDKLKIDPHSRSEILAIAHSLDNQIIGVKIRLKISVSGTTS